MKYFQCILVCLFIGMQGELRAQELDQDVVSLKGTCEKLIENPRDKESLQYLLAYAKNTNGIDRLRSRCMAGYALSALFVGNTNLYVRARTSHARTYPSDKHLLKVDPKSCYVPCKVCDGNGFVKIVCPVCQGKKEVPCPVCKGKGVRMSKKTLKGTKTVGKFTCATCDGSGKIKCNRCNGSGKIAIKCKACKGKPYTFKTPLKVQDDFALILRGIVKWIDNEEMFFSAYQETKQISDLEERIASYKKLISSYRYRDEIKELEQQLASDIEKQQKQKKIENELKLKEKREVQGLFNLKESKTPAAAATTIREYLESHPESDSKIELQTIVDALDAKVQRKQHNRRMLYVLAGVLVLLFGLSCMNFSRRKSEVVKRRPRFPNEKG